MLIVWDEPKRIANLDKHGLDFAHLDASFFLGAVVRAARGNRLQAIGTANGRLLSVIFRPLGREAISLISMRPASEKEARLR